MMDVEYQRPPVKVALMGLGRSMFADHYPIFREHPSLFKVVAACDLVKERRDRIAKDFPECRMFRQFSDMLDEREIDLVDIATCSKDHVQHAMMSLKRGFWTLLETPLALSLEDAQLLRGQAQKSQNRLILLHRGMFSPDFLLARQVMTDARLGAIHRIRVCREDYVRRDDWQCVKRLGGGAAFYAMPDLMFQALKLLPSAPFQMWSELKRIASLGDSEDYAHVILKTRDLVSADVTFNGGAIPGIRRPSFEIQGERGVFLIDPDSSVGRLRIIDPNFKFPRRRSSVRTPPIIDLHEKFPIVELEMRLPRGTLQGPSAFWRHVYDSVRLGVAFPLQVEEAIEALKFSFLMKKTSPFGK